MKEGDLYYTESSLCIHFESLLLLICKIQKLGLAVNYETKASQFHSIRLLKITALTLKLNMKTCMYSTV